MRLATAEHNSAMGKLAERYPGVTIGWSKKRDEYTATFDNGDKVTSPWPNLLSEMIARRFTIDVKDAKA